MRIFVVIPAYNEERRITETLVDYTNTLIRRYGDNITLLVVSDSTDKTDDVVETYGKKVKQVRVVHNEKRIAKGGSVWRGFRMACEELKGDDDIIGFADADDSVHGDGLIKLIDYLVDNREIDGVIGSRYMQGSEIVGQKLSAKRIIASRFFNGYVRFLFGFHFKDTQCGAKFFRRGALSSLLDRFVLTDITFDINLLYEFAKAKKNVVEVPIAYYHNEMDSKILMRSRIPQMFIVALGYRLVRSRLGYLFPKGIQYKIYDLFRSW